MKRYRQFHPLLISDFEVEQWQHPAHKHNHYELIFIKKGLGHHYINQLEIPYREGDVFLLGPEEEHYFDVRSLTRFIYIKFTDAYAYKENSGGLSNLEYLIKSRETHLSSFNLKESDRKIIAQLFEVIISLKADAFYNENVIWLQVLSIAAILQRNMPELQASRSQSRDMKAIFCYIHKHIYDPGMLKSTQMAEQFHTTTDYIGPYFKRNTGLTLRQYIRDYRLNLIQARIASGNYSFKEITREFGLTDESHLSKILKNGKSQK